jgi:disulfide oxidoreductase YuzD
VEKFMKKKYATEKSVKCYEKILREKDGLEKAVKYSGKVRREKRFYGKICEITRKYPNQNFPLNYKENKVLLEEQIFPCNYQNFSS